MNSPTHVLLEGLIKYRDNRKWKTRWAVVSKLSPVADCLHLSLYRNGKDKFRSASPRRLIIVEGYLGIETGFTLDRESNTLAVICKDVTVVLLFETREILHQWQTKLQSHFCKEQHYLVHIVSLPPKSKLACGPARLLLQDFVFCLVSGIPPRLLGYWPLEQLRRFGSVEGKFCFEGGSHCVKGVGLHVLYTNEADEINKCFELASCGQMMNVQNLHKNDCDSYYRRPNNDSLLLYKYANGGSNHENSTSHRVHKSASSESSNCDSCSHISIAESSRSNYYLDDHHVMRQISGPVSKCASIFHSSIDLHNHCHNRHHVCQRNDDCSTRHRCDCDSGSNVVCGCATRRNSMFGVNTISRISDAKIGLSLPCDGKHHFQPHNGDQLCSPTDTLKPSSPTATSVVSLAGAHCPLLGTDRESLFSHSSSQSSNSSSSSSGCSSMIGATDQHHGGCTRDHRNQSLFCRAPNGNGVGGRILLNGDNNNSNSRSGSSHSAEKHPNARLNNGDACDQIRGNNHECGNACSRAHDVTDVVAADGFIIHKGDHRLPADSRRATSKFATTTTTAPNHSYSQINFMRRNGAQRKQTSSFADQMANYDIPRNVCVKNVSLLNANKECLVASPAAVINHCHCDAASVHRRNGHGQHVDFLPSIDAHHQNRAQREKNGLTESTLMRHTVFNAGEDAPHSKRQQQQSWPATCNAISSQQTLNTSLTETINDGPNDGNGNPATTSSLSTLLLLSDSSNDAKSTGVQANYANMQFINSIDLYENLRFDLHKPNDENHLSVKSARRNHDETSISQSPILIKGVDDEFDEIITTTTLIRRETDRGTRQSENVAAAAIAKVVNEKAGSKTDCVGNCHDCFRSASNANCHHHHHNHQCESKSGDESVPVNCDKIPDDEQYRAECSSMSEQNDCARAAVCDLDRSSKWCTSKRSHLHCFSAPSVAECVSMKSQWCGKNGNMYSMEQATTTEGPSIYSGIKRAASDGDHYRAHHQHHHHHHHHPRIANISLSSSLHNRCIARFGRKECSCDDADADRAMRTQWSIANAIRASCSNSGSLSLQRCRSQRHGIYLNGSKSLQCLKSYHSIDDMTQRDQLEKQSDKCMKMMTSMSAAPPLPPPRRHKSDEVLSRGNKCKQKPLAAIWNHCAQTTADDSSDSADDDDDQEEDSMTTTEDFYSSSQITVLCQSQNKNA